MSEAWLVLRKRLGRARRLLQSLSPQELVELVRVANESPESYARRARALSLHSTSRVVFVCHGNIMRSAFAAEYVRERFPALGDRVISAGTHASLGSQAHPDAQKVAAEIGIDLSHHTATPLHEAGLQPSDVVIGMDLPNVARCRRTSGAGNGRIFLIGDVMAVAQPVNANQSREIHDPYDLGLDVTQRAFRRVQVACDAWGRLLTTGLA